jgi:hypothetical protein
MDSFSFSAISAFSAIGKTVSSARSRLHSIKSDESELTPENWCRLQPCTKIKLASKEIILTQPTSTFLVYALGLQTTGTGLYFLHISGSDISRLWWGISLALWGIGALLAGTSYQGFAYEIKCAGRQSCAWTSWWEVIYLMFQQVSMATMLVAVAYSCTEGLLLKILLIYALVSGVLYVGSTLTAAFVPVKSLLTFNFMVRVSSPILLIFLILNSWRYFMFREPMDLALLVTWILLLLTSAAYCLYDNLDITEKLWAKGKGFWFSQNDVLHVCLIFWVLYIGTVVANRVKDYAVPVLAG